ncbi:MAG: hypothetical protein QME27_04945, partial [Syntrophaceae bacterium]|nr:hypothetical protein [Syntrophaceae bacterium]
ERAFGTHQERLVKECQEQIELSGFVAHELSAFSVLSGGLTFRTGGKRRTCAFLNHFSGDELSTAIHPQLLESKAGDGCG